MGESKRLIKNTGIIAIGGVTTKLLQFFLLPLYTHALTPAEFGIVDYMNTVALFLVPVVSVLMDEALFRYLIDCSSESDRIRVATNSCTILAAGCVLCLFCGFVTNIVFVSHVLDWIIGLVLSNTLLQITSALLRGFGKTTEYALLSFLSSLITMVLNVVLIVGLNMGVAGMLIATVAGQSIVSLVFLISERVWLYLDFRTLDRDFLIELCLYSLPLIPNKVSWAIMNMLDRVVIMNTIGAEQAGVYAVAYKFPNLMDTVYGFFYQAWKESTARVLNSDEDQDAFFDKVYCILKRFMISLVLCLISLMPLLYQFLVDISYSEGLMYVPILLLATYYSNMSGFYGGIFTAYRETKIMGTTTLVSAVICVVLCVVLIPIMGLYGASIATLLAIFAVNEYRKLKVASFVHLSESRSDTFLTPIIVAFVLLFYYLSIIRNNPFYMIPCIVISLTYSVIMNKSLLNMLAVILYKRFMQR